MSIQKLISLCHKYLDNEDDLVVSDIDVNVLVFIAYDMGDDFTIDDIIAYSKLEELKDYKDVINMIYNFDEENEVLSEAKEQE